MKKENELDALLDDIINHLYRDKDPVDIAAVHKVSATTVKNWAQKLRDEKFDIPRAPGFNAKMAIARAHKRHKDKVLEVVNG